MSQETNHKRIAKNTLMLYFRMMLTMGVSLYTVRIVLETLGVEDYGIYSVVGGVVSVLSFFSVTMASATQRFFSHALGLNDIKKLKTIFTVNFIIYLVISVLVLVILETVGLWFFTEKLQLPPDRFQSALWVYHFSVFTFITTIFTTPFIAIIIAHEDMHIYAYVSIVEVLMKLIIVFLLVYISSDKLELYSVLIFLVSIITAFIYTYINIKKYIECQFKEFYWNKSLLREIIDFTGWTLFGQITSVARNQGVTILLNQVFTPAIVAARTISFSVTSQINSFSNNFNLGLYPSIIKTYAANDKKEMFSLIFNGSKITFFLMWVFALPIFIEMKTIISIWLVNPPAEVILFTQLGLIEVLINSICLPIITAARAPGKMKRYELTLGAIQILTFATAWFVLIMGGAAYTVFVVAIVANLIMFIFRLLIVRGLIGFPLRSYFRQVVIPILIVVLLSIIVSYSFYLLLPRGILSTIILIFLSMISSSFFMYFVALDKPFQKKIRSIIVNRFNKLLKSIIR